MRKSISKFAVIVKFLIISKISTSKKVLKTLNDSCVRIQKIRFTIKQFTRVFFIKSLVIHFMQKLIKLIH